MASGVIRRHCVQSERALARTVERLVAVCTAEYCQASWPQDGATLVAIIACGRRAWAQLAALPVLPLPIEIPPEGMWTCRKSLEKVEVLTGSLTF